MKFRVTYTVQMTDRPEHFACEYASMSQAETEMRDIQGYEMVSDCRIVPIDSTDPVQEGPFKIETDSIWDRVTGG